MGFVMKNLKAGTSFSQRIQGFSSQLRFHQCSILINLISGICPSGAAIATDPVSLHPRTRNER
jgi:hypothetical protein